MKRFNLSFAITVLGITMLWGQNADVCKSDAIIQESNMQFLKAAELYEKAGQLYEKQNKTDAFMFYKAGQCFIKAKMYNRSLGNLDKAKENNYNDADLYLKYSDAYVGIKDFNKAEKALLDGKRIFPESQTDFTKKMGYLYFNSAQYDKAVQYLKMAIGQEPNNYTYHYLLGSSYERIKKYQEAILEFERVIQLEPQHQKSIKKIGVLHFRLSDFLYTKEAKQYATLQNPTRVDYHRSTKKLEQIAQGYKKALPYLEQTHASSPKDEAIIKCLSIAYRRLKMEEKAAKMSALLK